MNSRTTLYIFSGLGADKTAFQFLDFGKFNSTYIDWIPPKEKESLEAYAKRLLEDRLPRTDYPPILLGLSFGGMIAIEISKIIPTEKVILISSIQTKKSIPTFQKIVGGSGIINFLPITPVMSPNPITDKMFGANTPESKEILYQILKNTDRTFLKWAFSAIAHWKNETTPTNLVSIHGTKDMIFSHSSEKHDYLIQDGGHMMVLTHPIEVSEILKQIM